MSITAEIADVETQQDENTFLRAWRQTVGPRTSQRTTGIPETVFGSAREYSRLIGRFPVLSGDEEMSVAKAIEAGVIADGKLTSSLEMPPAVVAELLLLALHGDTAYQSLIQSNLKLVVCVAKRFSEHDGTLMEMILDGNQGLVHAVESYDFRRGTRFAAHATSWIEQAIELGLVELLSSP